MNEAQILLSNRDTLLVAIPFLLMLFLSIFRLDQIIATPKVSQSRLRMACSIDELGENIMCDPDGRPSGARMRRQGAGEMIERRIR